MPHDATPLDAALFRAELRYGTIGDIELAQFDASPVQSVRRPRHITGSDTENLFLVRQISGRFALEQSGRSAMLESGDMVLIESTLPSTGAYFEDSRGMSVKLSRSMLLDVVGNPADLVGRPIRRTCGAPALLSSFLATLANHAGTLDEPANNVTVDYLLRLLAHVLGRRAAAWQG
jgi:hypothetical protein